MNKNKQKIFDSKVLKEALCNAFKNLNPKCMIESPVMFLVEIGAFVTSVNAVFNAMTGVSCVFELQISLWLWFTVIFSNFASALAQGRGKAQTQSLKQSQSDTFASLINENGEKETVSALMLKKGDRVEVVDGETIPCDGEIESGVALVDESAITGESAPVVRESGGDKSAVTGGTKVLSGTIRVLITTNPGETFLDQMIKMVEGAKRQKTPNEVALEILLIGLTVLFVVVVLTLKYFAGYLGAEISLVVLVSLVVCLIPTTIGGLLPAIGISGMDRLLRHNVIALSARAVEASGDVNVVLLDKTGTITLGNRLATEFIPAVGVDEKALAEMSMLASLADETPEGRSIVILAKERLGIKGRDISAPEGASFVEFSANTRMSGIDFQGKEVRKGAADAIEAYSKSYNSEFPSEIHQAVEMVATQGGTPLVVAENGKVLGVIRLKDILKNGIKERLDELHEMGIKSVMVTGDNPMTAAAISAEAGVSDFIAQAKPETKLEKIREYQKNGYMVAMIGDGTNDAPALAQADVAVAMNAGTQAAREAANMIDLDSSPTKLLDIVEIGKQILITRGSLTTFSVANDVAKYFAIIPALFTVKYPVLGVLDIMNLASPESAILSAVIFNALVIPALIPLSLKGVKYKQTSPERLLIKNLLIYGLGGLILPFIGIKLIDMVLSALPFFTFNLR